jgi:predicted O-methyltransferase YrrM
MAKHRAKLLMDRSLITVTDFGAGSKVFKSEKRKVCAIARHAGVSCHRAKMLYRVINYFKPKEIVEIGTSVGLATLPMALGNRASSIHSAEGCQATFSVAQKHLNDSGIDNVYLYNLEFTGFLSQMSAQKTQVDLAYVDGNHTKTATLAYFEALLPLISKDSILIFDDIHWSKEMEEAWDTIKDHPAVTVTIDTFQWGLVFFRSGQEKEHFTIRC